MLVHNFVRNLTRVGSRGVEAPYAVAVWAGAGPEGGSGNALDGAVLAARAHLLVVTLNYRIGLLGKNCPLAKSKYKSRYKNKSTQLRVYSQHIP